MPQSRMLGGSATRVKNKVQPVPRSVTLFELGEKDDLKDHIKDGPRRCTRSRSSSRGRRHTRVNPSHLSLSSATASSAAVSSAASEMASCSICQWVTKQTEHNRIKTKDSKEKREAEKRGRTKDRAHKSSMPRSKSAFQFSSSQGPTRILSPEACRRIAKPSRYEGPSGGSRQEVLCRDALVPTTLDLRKSQVRMPKTGPERYNSHKQTPERATSKSYKVKSESKPETPKVLAKNRTQELRPMTPDSDRQAMGCLWVKSVSQSKTTTYTRYSYDIDCPDCNGYAYETTKYETREKRRDLKYKDYGDPSRNDQLRRLKKELLQQQQKLMLKQQVTDKARHDEDKQERHRTQERPHRGPPRIIYVDDPLSLPMDTSRGKRVSRHSSLKEHNTPAAATNTQMQKNYKRRFTWMHRQSEGGGALPMTQRDGCKERSVSLSGSAEVNRTQPHVNVNRTRSCTGGSMRIQRQRSYKRTEDDDKIKKSRAWANAYELSQDLHEKQLEMLERKYGGHLRARRAARIIQQAFRQYCMNKNFEKLRQGAGEKRLSRRLGELGRSATIWSDMVADSSYNVTVRYNHAGYLEGNSYMLEDNHYHHNSPATTDNLLDISRGSYRGMLQKSKSLNIAAAEQAHMLQQQQLQRLRQSPRPPPHSMGLDLAAVPEPSATEKIPPLTHVSPMTPSPVADAKPKHPQTISSPQETNNNRNSYPEMNDSSASDSPQGTPVEPMVDLPSVNFENLLESKETDILNDSFHSDSSSQEDLDQIGDDDDGAFQSHNHSFDQLEASDSDHSTLKANSSFTYQDYPVRYSESSSDTVSVTSDVQIRVEEAEHNESTASLQDTAAQSGDDDTLTRVYGNAEVKLRRKKSNNFDCEGEYDSPQPPSSPSKMSPEASPIWKRKSAFGMTNSMIEDSKRMSNISEVSEPESLHSAEMREGVSSSQSSDTASMCSEGSNQMLTGYHTSLPSTSPKHGSPPKVTDRQRKRMYRIGLNLFNKKPEKGIKYLIERRFVDNSPIAVAKFLISRKGLSKQMIGEFLGNLQKQFNSESLEYFAEEIDLSGLQVDVALRKFQSYFRMPGEAQKIERLVEAFAHRYCMCNPDQVKKFRSPETVFLLSFAIIMLNTDLHNASIKPNRKMKLEDFIRNLRGIDDGEDVDKDVLSGIYERIRAIEFKPGTDHVTQVVKVEQMVTGKKPQLALTYRRLVCYCRLYQVNDPNKREKLGLHQREVFLFNDLLMVTKIFSKKKTVTYSFRQSFNLLGMVVYLFQTNHYQFGIRLCSNIDNKILITFNARNEHDRSRFVEDLKEAILEVNEMEALRIEEELQKQRNSQNTQFNRHSNDSGMVDIEMLKPSDHGVNRLSAPECALKKTNLSSSLIDLADGGRRGSGGSLDSGMASTSSGSTGSREEPLHGKVPKQPSGSKLTGIFKKKQSSKSSLKNNTEDASEV